MLTYIPRLRAFARTLTGQQASADDIAQETVLRAWRARDHFTLGTNMEAWLFRILRNLHLTGIRRDRRATWVDESAIDDIPAIDDPGASVRLNDLRRALNQLTPEQREALILIGASGWSYQQAAEHAQCPVGTMKSRVFRARRTLAAKLESGAVARDATPASEAFGRLLAMADAAEASAS